jgi:putative transposase
VERTVKLRVKVDYKTYSALKEVKEKYRAILEDAINYGLKNKTTSFTRIKAGIYKAEKEKHKDLLSHYIYTACEDASERLDSFMIVKRKRRSYTDRPVVRRVTVHLDDHLWKFSLSTISILTKRSRVNISLTFSKIF